MSRWKRAQVVSDSLLMLQSIDRLVVCVVMVCVVALVACSSPGGQQAQATQTAAQAATQVKAQHCEQLSRQLEAALAVPVPQRDPSDNPAIFTIRFTAWKEAKDTAQSRYDAECKL